MFEIAGTIKKVFEEQTFGGGFNKREFVLTIASGRFPQDIKFECVKDKVALVAGLKPGDKVKVSFDLRGREWKENYYVNLNAWKITPEGRPRPRRTTPARRCPKSPAKRSPTKTCRFEGREGAKGRLGFT